MLIAEDDILLVHMGSAEIPDAFLCFILHGQSLLAFSVCTSIHSEGEELPTMEERWVRKTVP